MPDPPTDKAPDDDAQRSATRALAELVARRKAATQGPARTRGPDRQGERAAAARSASKSKPAMKKP